MTPGARVEIDGDSVVKWFVDDAWLQREPDLAAREAAALELLASGALAFPTPRLLDVGDRWVRMSRLDGVPVWTPPSVEALAEVAVALHGVAAPPDLRRYRRYDLHPQVPAWSRRPEMWERAIEVAAGAADLDCSATFIHRDHHAGNVLWVGGAVSGVVDFVEACVGPRAVDAARMRLNLARVGRLDLAARYASCEGIAVDPVWDLVDALDMAPVSGPWVEPFVAAALAELG